MSRIAYIAEIDPREVGALGFLAGLLQGQGIAQGAVLAAVLDRIQLVEVPDDWTGPDTSGVDEDAAPEVDGGYDSSVGGDVIEFPTPEAEASSELPHIDPLTDPTSPESLGIALNQPAPPQPPPPPMNHQDDFGAGPPPREG